jgi:hypothetical protein
MSGELYDFFEQDHRRLELLLEKATAPEDGFDMEAYIAFRQGLLKHIRMEETILLPAALKLRGGDPLPIASKIRLDHGALTALMVPPPVEGNHPRGERYPGRPRSARRRARRHVRVD